MNPWLDTVELSFVRGGYEGNSVAHSVFLAWRTPDFERHVEHQDILTMTLLSLVDHWWLSPRNKFVGWPASLSLPSLNDEDCISYTRLHRARHTPGEIP